MRRVWATDDVAPADRQAYWREAVCATFVNLDVRMSPHDTGYRGRIGAAELGPIRVCFIDADPMDVFRTERHIARVREDDLLVGLQVLGRASGVQDGRAAELPRGTFALFDASRPYRVDFTGHDRFVHVVLQFPRTMLETRIGSTRRLTARASGGSGGLDAFAARFMLALGRDAPQVPDAKAGVLADDIIDLVALSLQPGADVASPGRVLWRRVGDHICHHRADATLSPETVAAAHQISTRTLYNLFATYADRPVTAWIQQVRFEAIRRDLRDPAYDRLTIAQVGERNGVSNTAYLSRSYRSRFGLSPREERATRSFGSLDEPTRHRGSRRIARPLPTHPPGEQDAGDSRSDDLRGARHQHRLVNG